jgi:hypothetical protein
MIVRWEDCIRRAFAAVALLAVISLFEGGLAQDAMPQPNADPASSPAKANAAGPSYLEPLNPGETIGVLGKSVVAPNGEGLGLITDVIVDRTGQPRAAIIDFGGFLGVGSRKIAVDWNALHFPASAKKTEQITLELTPDQVKAAPEYQDGKPVVVLGALGKLEPLPYP